jgi:hypothetical protein
MREIPILFSTPMVQAILDGRKTMTRRVIKRGNVLPTGEWLGEIREGGQWCTNPKPDVLWTGFKSQYGAEAYYMCPYGQPGDRLWVKETWWADREIWQDAGTFLYKADAPFPAPWSNDFKWRSSRFMPKAAARIWLEVVNVRVERLKEITQDDAVSEGMTRHIRRELGWAACESEEEFNLTQARSTFQELWDHLNAKRGYGWDENPWVWVVSFRRIEK